MQYDRGMCDAGVLVWCAVMGGVSCCCAVVRRMTLFCPSFLLM